MPNQTAGWACGANVAGGWIGRGVGSFNDAKSELVWGVQPRSINDETGTSC